jgi:beta-glucosidase
VKFIWEIWDQLPTGRPAKDANLNVPPGPRWLSRYIDAPNAALFPFGFGLSYSQFGYSEVTLSRQSIPIHEAVAGAKSLVIAKATVTNTGKVSATEVVQCYVGNVGTSIEQPIRSLQGFTRVTLAPGESKEINFPLGFEELSFWDNAGHQLVEPSLYNVWIGGDSLAANLAQFQIAQ